MIDEKDPRIDAIVEALQAYARQDFSVKAPISERVDVVDAIATGLNMMAEELDGEVASRRELELAYRKLQQTQAMLAHSGKLVAIGQLASGVAHEISNPASWVSMSLALIARQLGALQELISRTADPELRARFARLADPLGAALEDAVDGMERIRTIATDLRTFSRADGDAVEPVSLCDVVTSAARLAGAALRGRAHTSMTLDSRAWVLGNRGRLGQVVTNLLVNAAQAIGEDAGAGQQVRIEVAVEGDEAVVAVEDSGPGVPPHLRERIFEPYFTTKPADQGTGLGLSLVAEIVHRHHGTVRALDATLGGARFEIRLPRVEEQAQATAPSARSAPAAATRRRVLLIDDEPNLLRTYALLLQPDHDVCTALGGAAAIERLRTDDGFDVVVCDLQMPEVDGIAVYEHLERTAPAIAKRMIFSTAAAFHERVKDFLARTSAPVLEKPVPPAALLEAIAARPRRAPGM